MSIYEATITSKGQITLPARLRADLGLKPGDKVIFTEEPDGSVTLEGKTASFADLRGMVKPEIGLITDEQVGRWIDQARSARWLSAASDDKE